MKWGEGEGTEGGGKVDSAVALAGAAGSVSSLRELQPPGGSEGGTALRGQGLSSVEAAEGADCRKHWGPIWSGNRSDEQCAFGSRTCRPPGAPVWERPCGEPQLDPC